MSGMIRPLALGVIVRGREILVHDAYDSVKRQRFHRLLGGGIEFGERAADAVAREFREETGFEVRVVRLLGVLENVFTHEGGDGHEICFVFEVAVADAGLYERETFEVVEVVRGRQVRSTMIWVDLDDLDVPLYPDGVLDLIAHVS